MLTKEQFQKGKKKAANPFRINGLSHTTNGGVDGTRTRDPRRDRPVF